MIFRTDSQRPTDLYRMFRDSLIEDSIRLAQYRFDLWAVLPTGMAGNRLQTQTLLRKMATRLTQQFPGGIKHQKGVVTFDPVFIEFVKTQRELASYEDDAVKAWAAFRSIEEDANATGA